MKTLEHIDGFILNKFERFSHFMQRTFGTRSVDLERFSLACSLLFTLIRESQLMGWGSAGFVAILTSLSFLFTSACDDLPPGESRVRKLVKALSAGMKQQVPVSNKVRQ